MSQEPRQELHRGEAANPSPAADGKGIEWAICFSGGGIQSALIVWVRWLAPWDIQAYAAAHPEFPGQSTARQLYDGAEFDAYRGLGMSTVRAAEKGGLGAR